MTPHRHRPTPVVECALLGAAVLVGFVSAAAPASAQGPERPGWTVPRTPDGHPDLQGNWTNATITPLQRPLGLGPVLTPQQVAAIESGRADLIAELSAPSDPDREAPAAGGYVIGDPLFDAAAGGTGGYNYFYIDGGDHVAIYDGEPRSSLITIPASGRMPALTPEAQARLAARRAALAGMGEYDNPENRPLAERCVTSFGSNAGPPMLPNYFYNNNYTIVQTADHVVLLTEMVHDARIVRLGERRALPADVRPWFGDSWGWWEGDTLVIETTNISMTQMGESTYIHPGGSESMRVTERLTRVSENTIHYEFTVDDPGMYAEPWGGQVPFRRMDDLVYEYACHEGNYALANVLSGARAQERSARR